MKKNKNSIQIKKINYQKKKNKVVRSSHQYAVCQFILNNQIEYIVMVLIRT